MGTCSVYVISSFDNQHHLRRAAFGSEICSLQNLSFQLPQDPASSRLRVSCPCLRPLPHNKKTSCRCLTLHPLAGSPRTEITHSTSTKIIPGYPCFCLGALSPYTASPGHVNIHLTRHHSAWATDSLTRTEESHNKYYQAITSTQTI